MAVHTKLASAAVVPISLQYSCTWKAVHAQPAVHMTVQVFAVLPSQPCPTCSCGMPVVSRFCLSLMSCGASGERTISGLHVSDD